MQTIILDHKSIAEFMTGSAKKYEVYEINRQWQRIRTIKRNLSEAEAQKLVKSYPSSETTMVVYNGQ